MVQPSNLPRKTKAISSIFQRKSIDLSCGLTGTVYFRDSINAVKRQISETTFNKMIMTALKHPIFLSHPMNSNIGMKIVPAVQHAIQNTFSSVSWKYLEEDREQSFLCLLQVYSNESIKSMKTTGIKFHQLHLTILYSMESTQRKQISSVVSF